MSELILVRHAQASFGQDDYDRLSDLGHQQARWLGEYFKSRELRFHRVICGDMLRHRQTLEGIFSGMELDPPTSHTQPGWNEFDFEALIAGYLAEQPAERPEIDATAKVFSQLLRNTLRAWADGRITASLPESWSDFEKRVGSALSQAKQLAGRKRKILVVSSGGAISMALRQVLAAPPHAMIQMNLQARNTSCSHLFRKREGLQFAGFNHIPHLDHPDRGNAITYY